jgi:hypothetical protein
MSTVSSGIITRPPSFISSLPTPYTVTTVVQTEINEPVFGFYIPENEFYINIPALSVAINSKSATNFDDCSFSILNKNSVPIYYKDIVLNSGVIRGSYVKSSDRNLIINLNSTTTDDTYTYITYSVQRNLQLKSFKTATFINSSPNSPIIGYLTLRVLNKYYNNTGIIIYPYESVPFSANYIIENVGDLTNQFYGNTNTTPNKKVGTFDFSFLIETYDSDPKNINKIPNILQEELVISVNLVNTGYVPPVYNNLISRPATGGGFAPPSQVI